MIKRISAVLALALFYINAYSQNDFCTKMNSLAEDCATNYRTFSGAYKNGVVPGTANVPGSVKEYLDKGIASPKNDYWVVMYSGKTEAQADSVCNILKDKIASCTFPNFKYNLTTSHNGIYRYYFTNTKEKDPEFEGLLSISIFCIPRGSIMNPSSYEATIVFVNK